MLTALRSINLGTLCGSLIDLPPLVLALVIACPSAVWQLFWVPRAQCSFCAMMTFFALISIDVAERRLRC